MLEARRFALIIVALAVAIPGTGCVTKKLFNSSVADTGARITSVESAVEANERRISGLRQDTDERISRLHDLTTTAAERAEVAEHVAEKAARGRLLWTVTVSDDNLRFGFDKAAVSEASRTELDGLVRDVMALERAVYLEIEGHTDSMGSDDYNLRLGERRATAVRNYLNESGGIPLHAMSVISYGESQPLADNTTDSGRAQNRRVVIRVLE